MAYSQNVTTGQLVLDVRWGSDLHARVDLFKHATRLPGGNPVFVIRHDGLMTGDRRAPWVAGGRLNVFANWLNQQTALPCDVWSVESPQMRWDSPTAAAHLTTTTDEAATRAVYAPESVEWLRSFVQWAKRHAEGGEPHPDLGATLGNHVRDIFGVGDALGALLWAIAAYAGPRAPKTSGGTLVQGVRFGPYATDSTLRGLVLLGMPIDLRSIGGEQVYPTAVRGLFGTLTTGEWNRVPQLAKAACSPLAYVQRGETRWHVPQYVVHEDLGNHVKPYGDPATGAGADLRDGAQWTTYTQALAAANLSWAGELIATNDWNDEALGAAISARVHTWARAVMGR